MTAVLSFETCVYFYVLGCYDHVLNTDGNSVFLISVKAQKSRRKEFDPVCFQQHMKMAISIMM